MRCIHAKLYYKYDKYIASCVRETTADDINKYNDISLMPYNYTEFLSSILNEDDKFICKDCGKIFTVNEWRNYYTSFLSIVNEWYRIEHRYQFPLSKETVISNLLENNLLGPKILINNEECNCIHALYNNESNRYDMQIDFKSIDNDIKIVCKLCNMVLGSIFDEFDISSYYNTCLFDPEIIMVRQPLWPEEMEERLKDTGLLGQDIGEGKYIGFKRAKQE